MPTSWSNEGIEGRSGGGISGGAVEGTAPLEEPDEHIVGARIGDACDGGGGAGLTGMLITPALG